MYLSTEPLIKFSRLPSCVERTGKARATGIRVLGAILAALLLATVLPPWSAHAEGVRVKYRSGDAYLVVEFLDDDLVHFELSPSGPGPDVGQPLYTTPMVHKTDYPGPSDLVDDGEGTLETPAVRVQVDRDSLCVTVTDLSRDSDLVLTTLCPHNLAEPWRGLTFTPEGFTHAYGLGQSFPTPPSADGDWAGRIRSPGSEMGNALFDWNGGHVGDTQFPVLYLAGEGMDSYALFLDNQYVQRWDLLSDPWMVEMKGDPLRFYVLAGPNLQDLRKDYMELVGRPPVPPKAAFGLWVSEYGYENWAEVEDKLRTLRANGFPVDGFVLDLQWFGGVRYGSDKSSTGSLSWDRRRFPDPEIQIAELREREGVGIMTIEHAYVSKDLDEYQALEKRGFLVRACEDCEPTYLTRSPYWGQGSMIDWSNDDAGAFWHDRERAPLIEDGVMGHWTDLGEPQMYDKGAWYEGLPGTSLHAHEDVHNLYNLMWSRSIYEGYVRNGHEQRPFILSRSGAPGSQRYGVCMWSADIGSNLRSLAGHLNAQMHVSMSGIDYYGADIGGFYREALDGDLDEMYTLWFANGAAFDVPARPHTLNLCNCRETAPDRVGDLRSNLDNLRQRYELIPYLYSLAHRAYLYGEPVVPPLVYYYQQDPEVREMGSEKLLGRDLLIASVTAYSQTERTVYLPAGEWIDYYTHERYQSRGAWFGPFPTYLDGRFKLPTFARAGAILPKMHVDERTMNTTGRRIDGTRRDELIVRVYASEAPSAFTLYEDDGRTMAYERGQVRTTAVSQVQAGDAVTVTIDGATGTYTGALSIRDNVVELVVPSDTAVAEVTLNGYLLPPYSTRAELDAAPQGWVRAGDHLIVAKSGLANVTIAKTFAFHAKPTHRMAKSSAQHTTYLPLLANGHGVTPHSAPNAPLEYLDGLVLPQLDTTVRRSMQTGTEER